MQKRAALLIVLFLSPLVITSTASDDLRGVCAEGECTELPARVTCRGAHIDDSYLPSRYSAPSRENPPICDISERNCSKYQCSPGSCQSTSQNLWPHLNFTLEHYNYNNYGITVSWEQPANVTGYVLLMTDPPGEGRGERGRMRDGSCGGDGVAELDFCKCHHITNPSTTTHTQTRYYPDDSRDTPRTLYIKLIPIPWCNGPSITMTIPESCHNIRPGDCDTCGSPYPYTVSPPINVKWTPRPQLHGVFLTWEPGESYYGLPYPNISFFLKVDRFEGKTFTPDITPRLEVLGRTNVTLQNLELYVNYSVKIRAYDCSCGLDWSSPVFIYLNESFTLSSSPAGLSPTLVVLPPSATHLSTPTTLNSTPSTTHLSTPTTLNSTPSATHLSTPTTLNSTPSATHLSTPTTFNSTPSTTHLSTPTILNSTPSTTHLSTPTTLNSTPAVISPTPGPKQTDNHGVTAAGLTTLVAAVFIVITVGIAAVIVVMYRHMRKVRRHLPPSQRRDQDHPSPTGDPIKAMPQRMRVFLLYSQETPRQQQKIILQLLVYELQKYCVEVVYSSSIGQSSVPQWVENQVQDCDKVLCICNKEFKLEWEGKIRPLQGALVHCFKKLYLGTISRDCRAEHQKKYAIVLMNIAHEQLIPSDYLKECQMFLCEMDAVKNIAHFVLEVPTHCLPEETHSLTPTTPTTSTSTWDSTDNEDCISLA